MQESDTPAPAPKVSRGKLFSRLCGIAGIVCLIGVLATVLAVWCAAPTGDWRNAYTPTPWKGSNVTVEEASAVWKSSVGNEHMALRTAYYPEVSLKLGDAAGSGMFFISFYSVTGSQIGETLRIRYSKEGFQALDDEWTTSSGKEGKFRMSRGFDSADDYKMHELKQDEQLWRAEVSYLPEGSDDIIPLGFVSILPEEK